MKRLLILLSLLAWGCGEERPPAPTAGESEQLDEVENLLNEQAKEEGPAPESADPSRESN